MTKSTFNKRTLSMIAELEKTAEFKDGRLSFDLTQVTGYEKANKQAEEGREFRNDLTIAAGQVLLTTAAQEFENDDDVSNVSNVVPFGGVNHTLRAHRQFTAPSADGEDTTYHNYLTVESDDNFGGAMAKLREMNARVEESDELEDEVEEAVE